MINSKLIVVTYSTVYTPVDPKIARAETDRRQKIIDQLHNEFKDRVSDMVVTGSMAYGKNYCVTIDSDIDIQLLIRPENASNLTELLIASESEVIHAVRGYQFGVYKQFSLISERDGVKLEFHLWDEQSLINAITLQSSSTTRLRSTLDKPSTDHAFAFDRCELTRDFSARIVDGFIVGDFPTYTEFEHKLYFSRPISNVISIPEICFVSDSFITALETCWQSVINKLVGFFDGSSINLEQANVINILPHRDKLSPESRIAIEQKTKEFLKVI
ncbi:MAG TPA: hypothetical protein VLG47_03270 [Candidatus Saccharimonadales bacterium]|nr:hypothetical protein [Candidatus Saccharimonadales bacterium]